MSDLLRYQIYAKWRILLLYLFQPPTVVLLVLPGDGPVAVAQEETIFHLLMEAPLCVACKFSCCNDCCRDPMRICVVCIEREGKVQVIPPNLPSSEGWNHKYEDLTEECKYGMLENECSVAGRFCGFLRFPETACYGDSAFKIIDLVKVSLDRFRYGVEEQRLEAFTDKWDHVLSGISVDRPDDGMLCALFYEQVRELHCLKLDMQLWNRDASVRNYAYLRNICANAITTWLTKAIVAEEIVAKATANGKTNTRGLAHVRVKGIEEITVEVINDIPYLVPSETEIVAGLEAKFWPYACKHFCFARNIELNNGESAFQHRYGDPKFDSKVVLGDGEEYATPADVEDDAESVDFPDGLPDYDEWCDEGDEEREGVDITVDGSGKLPSYQRVGKFSPTSKPRMFLGYHFEIGGKWQGDYIVADLEDFKCDASRASIQANLLFSQRAVDISNDGNELFQEPGIDDDRALFEFASHGGGADYWERKIDENKVQYAGKSPVTIREEGYAFGKTRLMQLWSLVVAMDCHTNSQDQGSSVVIEVLRSNSTDSDSWRSMNRAEREGYVEAEMREAELRSMGREDSRDAAPVDIGYDGYDSTYDSPACREERDHWHHDPAAGTVTRCHVAERARFDPTAVKGCPVDPSLLSGARKTSAMTDGTEFTLQDNWRKKDPCTLPCRWTGKTVFVIGNAGKAKVKVSFDECATPAQLKTVQPKGGFYGHALQSIDSVIVPARSSVKVPTGVRFTSQEALTARVQPVQGSVLDVYPAMYTYHERSSHADVEVSNPIEHGHNILTQ
ncbi:JNK [Symbiodinium necroappetens]|uniref:JNK protein n=1 Tax=Symbiodinium necroappetens TaxID=1628268 RepID=A0A812LWU7_9DINO|nr:JNK [Symbiodinium necroappetens]